MVRVLVVPAKETPEIFVVVVPTANSAALEIHQGVNGEEATHVCAVLVVMVALFSVAPQIRGAAAHALRAAIEKINHVTSFVLRRIARWYLGHVGNLIEQRSNGIKDLRLGFMVDEDWKNEKSKRPGLYQRVQVPPLRGVHYHIILGSLSKDEKSLLARYFGDGLVTPGSAVAKTLLSVSHVKTFPGTGHNALLRRPNVHRYVKGVVKPFL